MILLAGFAKVRRAAVDLAACCCVWCSGTRAAAPAPSRRPAAPVPAFLRPARSAAPPFCGLAAFQRLAVVAPVPAPTLCAPMGSRPRRSRCPACALDRNFFSALVARGFPPRLRVLRRVWRALVRTTIPPRRFKRGAIARQKRLRGVGGRPAKDARRVCALKPPAAVFGLSCITFVSSRVRFCSIFSGRGEATPPTSECIADSLR